MKYLITIILILATLNPCEAASIFKKKDYKENFINNALDADRRNNTDSAFHLFEKAMYYYGNDKKVVESYADFCVRRKYYKKAAELYHKLFIMTKNKYYLFQEQLATIKDGKLTQNELKKITDTDFLNSRQKKQLYIALIQHFSYKEEWNMVKNFCNKISPKDINTDIISSCIISAEKSSDKKSEYNYFKRYSQLFPNDISIVKKVISLSKKMDDVKTEEIYTKKFSELLPDDNGIKYQLAGVFEKQKKFKEANKIYEELLKKGDKSEHVKKSYAYSLEQSKGIKKNIRFNPPIKLTKTQIQELAMYEALDKKEFKKAAVLLDSLIKIAPKNPKFIDLRANVAIAMKDYPNAIKYFEEYQRTNKSLAYENKKLLAFSYSKTNDYKQVKEIVDKLLEENPKSKELIELEFEYSMQFQDWNKALIFNEKLLALSPESEKLLKIQGDLFSINKDFPNSILWYEKLVQLYPKPEYFYTLANLFMANKEYSKAELLLEKFHEANPDNQDIALAYLNALMAQEKLQQSYWLVKKNNLEQTKEGCITLGDMAMLDKDWGLAQVYYKRALAKETENPNIKNKLAQTFRMLDNLDESEKLFKEVQKSHPENLEAKIGLAYIEIDRKEPKKAREKFYDILAKKPDYNSAKMGIIHSFASDNDNIRTIQTIDDMNLKDRETIQLKAQTYYNMHMYSDAKKVLKGYTDKEANSLRYKIKKDSAITFTPNYSFLIQQLSEEFKLNINKIGLNASAYVANNTKVFGEYNLYVYTSGNLYGTHANNVTNEVRGGFQGRPCEKFEYKADIGVKAFEFGGALVNTDSWAKYYFSDKFNLKLGFKRDNLEQSYVSAVGYPINGIFTGRVAENKVYLEYEYRYPKDYYSFGRAAYGIMAAQNLPTNQYLEGMIGAGKVIYNKPENKWIQIITADIVSYNTSYQYNLLNLYNNSGQLFGGYFSPSFYTANTLNLKFEGENKDLKIKYGLKGFLGAQVSITPNFVTPTGGITPYISYNPNDNISINLTYTYLNYADVQRNFAMVSVNIRGFDKNAKN